jgi:TRAP-type C4-dicarboxylate transport system substrate-binding protein
MTKVNEYPTVGAPIPADQLEAALDSMVDKLRTFNASLQPDEQDALQELLEAARVHSDDIQARDEGDLAKLVYDKPIQVHATYAMKEKMKQLPDLIKG